MGNVSGREEKSSREYYMECGQAQNLVILTSKLPQNPNMIMQIERGGFNESTRNYGSASPEKSIPAVISWIHGGTQVAIEGSWDDWKIRELLEGSGSGFSIFKVLKAGVYHYRFVVDGQWIYDPDLPHECDHLGNVFNVLDLKDNYPENTERDQEPECPSSPISSYNNPAITLDDFDKKLPEMPPLLQQMPLNQPSSSKNPQRDLQKPLSANLNHLYIKRDGGSQPVVALSSSQRFRTKFVTNVLYKPFKK
ncbi:5-AMP-activated protein kinase, beta subunit, interaction domain-containing protein, partial [Cynara cardunculus var. scolymus]